LQEKMRTIYRSQRERYRLGEIADPFAADARPPELVDLQKRFDALTEEQRELMVKDEYDQIYTAAGASGLNAFTNEDITVYFLTVPANKLELWFWMESDRLSSPVFREFYSERDVVHEERRLRTESTPTGEFDEVFEAMFWQSHPYGWPVVGWPSDLRSYSLAQARAYFDTYYAPGNLTAALVGNFDLEEARVLAEKYFGRIPARAAAPDVVTLEMDPLAEKRMVAECDCPPQVEIRYHSVPFRHRDAYALDVLAGLLNGRSGRLYKSLVLERDLATDASASQDSRKYAGAFSLYAEAKGAATPEDLERALLDEVRRIVEEPIPDRELQKVKNQITASAYEKLAGGFFLLIQLLVYDGLGDWRYLNDWAETTLAITGTDVKRAAERYLDPEERTVGLYYRKAGGDER
ncbi:MAG TPA: pitrilysin family protein, partial [Vicinamibacteria bacterium]